MALSIIQSSSVLDLRAGCGDDEDDETGIPPSEMVCAAQCDGWGLTLNVILTQTSPVIMRCVKISPWGHSIISLIDIQRGDKT